VAGEVVGEEHGTSVNLLVATTGPKGSRRGSALAATSRVEKRVAMGVCGSSER
jgi:hypothetical protein